MDIRYDRVCKKFGDVTALHELDLHISDGSFMVMLGPSGCGKTTGLRILAGLEEPTTGSILLGDRDVTNVPARERDIAMVFQSYALYPHMTVRENIAYPLRVRHLSRAERDRQAQVVAERLVIDQLLDRKPRELSGGQRQRVALARAIIRQPAAFLMDEPLSNLDAKLRIQMRVELKRLQRDLGVTTLYVTHDQSEATTMADCVAVMANGCLEQLGTPREIYDFPRNETVASFVGSPPMNVVDVGLAEHSIQVGGISMDASPELLTQARQAAKGKDLRLGVRPEDIVIAPDGDDPSSASSSCLGSEVYVVQPMDNETLVTFQVGPLQLTGRFSADFEPAVGSRVRIRLREERLHFFDRDSGECVLSTRQLAQQGNGTGELATEREMRIAGSV